MKTLQRLKATLLLSAALCLLWTQSYAQKDDGLIPSPEGQSTINRIQNPVNYYTGTVNIQAPLCSAEARGVSVPVSLNYTASAGIKVDDEATCVGLGWNLSAGGKITRIVKGHPDEMVRRSARRRWTDDKREIINHFDQSWFQWEYENVTDLAYDFFILSSDCIRRPELLQANMRHQAYNPKFDSEPDIFYFEIPGNSGMFILDHDMKAYTLPYQDIKIKFLGDHKTNKNYFIITDNSGNTYKFGTTDDSRERTATKKYVKSGNFNTLKEDIIYNTAWLLDEIQPFSGETVTFSYKESPFNSFIEQSPSYFAATYTDEPSLEITGYDEYSSYYNYYPRYIDQITWSKGKITFSYDLMTDLPKKKYTLLTGIQIFERNNKIKELHLDYSPFSESANNYRGPKLDAIWEQFGTDTRQDIFVFGYYIDPLTPPSRLSSFKDHWGYFNQRGQYKSMLPYIDDGNIKVDGHRKEPSLAHTWAGMLYSVKSANDETVLYRYELNEIYDERTAKNRPFGGLRIKEIIKKLGSTSNISISRFEYKKANGSSSGMPYSNDYLYHNGETVYSKCVSNIYDAVGRHVFYPRVTEYLPNGSKIVYHFDENIACSDPAFDPDRDIYPNDMGNDRLVRLMSPPNSFFWRRGLMTSKEIYENSALIMKETYEYSFGTPLKTIEAYAVQRIRGNKARINIYRWICEPVYHTKTKTYSGKYNLSSETSISYNLGKMLPVRTVTKDSEGNTYETRINYSGDFGNITQSNITDKTGMLAAIKYMFTKNALSIPIETISYKNGKVISANLNIFQTVIKQMEPVGIVPAKEMALPLKAAKENSSFTPSYIYNAASISEFRHDANYKTIINYDEYDSYTLLSSHEENGPAKSVLYGYDDTLPIAAVTNAVVSRSEGKNQVIYDSFESGANILKVPHSKSGDYVLNGYYSVPLNKLKPGKYSVSYWRKPRTSSNRADWEYVERIVNINSTTLPFTLASSSAYVYDELRVIPVDARMTTYSYRPGVGKISETDSNGITVYYEYNKYGLLKAVKDTDGRVIKKIVYDNYTSNL